MKTKKEKFNNAPVKKWWLILVSGIITMLIGFMIIIGGFEAEKTLILMFGSAVIVTGFMQLVTSIINDNPIIYKASIFFIGFFDVVLGVLILVNIFTYVFITYCIAGWMLYHGILIISFGKDLRDAKVPNVNWNTYAGSLLIILALCIFILSFLNSHRFNVLNVTLISWSFVFFGWLQITTSLQLRTAHLLIKMPEEVTKKKSR